MERQPASSMIRFVAELTVGSVPIGIEMGRYSALRPSLKGESNILPPSSEELKEIPPELIKSPAINPENTPDFIYEPLQHSGNIMDGYLLTMGFFYFMKFVPKIKELDEKIRLGTAWVASNLVVSGVETGFFFGQGSDLLDIPAGIAGSTLFLGARYASGLLKTRADQTETSVVSGS